MLRHSDTIKHMLISQLKEQTSSKATKLELTVVQGCLQGLTGCLQVLLLSLLSFLLDVILTNKGGI